MACLLFVITKKKMMSQIYNSVSKIIRCGDGQSGGAEDLHCYATQSS